MSATLLIRPHKHSDIPLLSSLMEEMGYPTSPLEIDLRIKKFLKNEGYGLLIATLSGEVVGFIAWSQSMLFVSNKTRLRIEGLVVHHTHRNKGIGKKLIEAIEKIARETTPAIIELTSGLRRGKKVHDFYRNLGYHNEDSMSKLYLRKEIE